MTKEQIQKHVIQQLELAQTSLNAATSFLIELGPTELFSAAMVRINRDQVHSRAEFFRKRFKVND